MMAAGDSPRVIVVGAGAAGLAASIFAAREGARVRLLESTTDGGRKILISGGGRCNVLPSEIDVNRYVTDSSRNSLRKILLSWPLAEQRAFFEEDLGVALALEPETGKVFPASNRARDVRDALVDEAVKAGVRVHFGARVTGIAATNPEAAKHPARSNGPGPAADGSDVGWTVWVGETGFQADRVILATGGLSVPKTGSDGWGLALLKRFGHDVVEPYPALTPLTADPAVHAALAGVSLRVALSAPAPGGPFEVEGGFLFTHRGWSGPATLNISHLATRAGSAGTQPILARWGGFTAKEWTAEMTDGGSRRVAAVLRQRLPDRLAERLMEESGVGGERPLAQLRREERDRLVAILTRYELPWTGDEGYRKAEVTGGGVRLADVRPDTLESRVVPGLFLCGELLDAFGPIGGYNFAWAWATGRAAGRGSAR